MAISSVLVNVSDVARSVDFYSRHLGLAVLEVGDDEAVLDAVTATLRISRLDAAVDSTWVADDVQSGFRHIGFKVADLDERVAALKAAAVPFHLDPLQAEGDVRITFFYDPDGTLIEFVEGPLQYHEVYDRDAVDRDHDLGDPERPRFDHVAETVSNPREAHAYYAGFGFVLMGGIHQLNDPRGFDITYLRHGDSSLEIFAFDGQRVVARAAQLDARGFVAMELEGSPATALSTAIGSRHGHPLFVDPDGLVLALERAF